MYLYLSHGSPRLVVVVLSMALCIIVPADILRLRHSGFERLYERLLGFLMRESEKVCSIHLSLLQAIRILIIFLRFQKATNGVIWYIIGAIWVLSLYPLDVAVVSILVYVFCAPISSFSDSNCFRLSWADTAASTIGRMWGRYTPRLPARLPILGLPLAPRKSVAGFIAGSVTGALITAGFWGSLSTLGSIVPIWSWAGGVAETGVLSGWVGLSIISTISGIISGISEALGKLDLL